MSKTKVSKIRVPRAFRSKIVALHKKIEAAFSPLTGLPRGKLAISEKQSTGHSWQAAMFLQHELDGEIIVVVYDNARHFYNRIQYGKRIFDVDITGDEHHYPNIQIQKEKELWNGSGQTVQLSEFTLRFAHVKKFTILAQAVGYKTSAIKTMLSKIKVEINPLQVSKSTNKEK